MIELCRGLSLIEILIAIAATCIFLATTLPAHRDSLIRDRVDTGIGQVAAARAALARTCSNDARAVVSRNEDAGYFYLPAIGGGNHVGRVELGADCAVNRMVIVVWTTNTGADRDPVIALGADPSAPGASWQCYLIDGDLRHVPPACKLESVELSGAHSQESWTGTADRLRRRSHM